VRVVHAAWPIHSISLLFRLIVPRHEAQAQVVAKPLAVANCSV
jgi:hypothetical protein